VKLWTNSENPASMLDFQIEVFALQKLLNNGYSAIRGGI